MKKSNVFAQLGIFLLLISVLFSLTKIREGKNNNRNKANPATEKVSIDTTKPRTYQPQIPVGKENFQKITSFIEKNGYLVSSRGLACDRQYNFLDSEGNRHAMIAIKRDAQNNPSVKGEIKQVSVWMYLGGIKDLDHFLGYKITPLEVSPFITKELADVKKMTIIRHGYEEFLFLVNK